MTKRSRKLGTILTSISVLASGMATALASTPAYAEPAPSAEVLAAIQRDLGLTPEQAKTRIAEEDRSAQLERTLVPKLGKALAGSWFDSRTGRLAVAVTGEEQAAQARAAGAEAVVVQHSADELTDIKNDLDAMAHQDRATIDGITKFAVDPRRNAVVVTVLKGHDNPALTQLLGQYGDAVKVEESTLAPRTTADFLDGGDSLGHCTAGFNAASNGVGYIFTAGHCGTPGQLAAGYDGTVIGPFVSSNFPGDDFALIRNDNPGYWTQTAWIDAEPSTSNNGWTVRTYGNQQVGSTMCKTGITTGTTCGVITFTNVTVEYPDGTMSGLVEHNACVEPGDSGGPNFGSWDAQNRVRALGMTSGAGLYDDLNTPEIEQRCGEVYGEPNFSWYQPIVEAVIAYGVEPMLG